MVLEKLKKNNILCEIYENSNDPENFYVGYILNFDKDSLVFESVSENGNHDGFYCISIDNLIQIKYKTKYLTNLEKLMASINFKRKDLNSEDANVLAQFLKRAKIEKQICYIEVLNNSSCALTGYISSLDSESLTIDLLNEYGESDGQGIINIEDITCVSIGTVELEKLKIIRN